MSLEKGRKKPATQPDDCGLHGSVNWAQISRLRAPTSAQGQKD